MSQDGGPAFPCPSCGTPMDVPLRDFFAGQALVGLMMDCEPERMCPGDKTEAQVQSERAYQVADAMLAQRSLKERAS